MSFDERRGSAPLQRISAWDAVTGSFADAWDRMVSILFRGPNATPVAWIWWGLIILLSGLVEFGSGGAGNASAWTDDDRLGVGRGLGNQGLSGMNPWTVVGIAGVACLAVALIIVMVYVLSRFRFVLLDGILYGQPRIREPWRRSSQIGLQYFVFQIALFLGILLLVTPVILLWVSVLSESTSGGEPAGMTLVTAIVASLLFVLPLSVLGGVVNLVVYDVTLPFAWQLEGGFKNALARTFRLVKARPAALLLFVLARIVVGVAGVVAFAIVACCSCVVWLPTVVLGALLFAAAFAVPPLFLLAIPGVIVLAFFCAWILATLSAPIFVFYRCWSYAFVRRLDEALPSWEDQGAVGPSVAPLGST